MAKNHPRSRAEAPFRQSSSAPLVTPLQPAVVYRTETPDTLDQIYDGTSAGYTYSREGHPNAAHLAAKIDAMEGATGGIVTSSGMAAVALALLAGAKAGDHVIGGDQLYGRSLRLLNEELPRLGIATSLADPTDIAAMRAAIRPETRVILVEVVSNPTIRVADMEGIAALAREKAFFWPWTIRSPHPLPFGLSSTGRISSYTRLPNFWPGILTPCWDMSSPGSRALLNGSPVLQQHWA